MTHTHSCPLVAVDVGNSRVKFGLFERRDSRSFPEPSRALVVASDWEPNEVEAWLPHDAGMLEWLIASVHRATAARLVEWLRGRRDWHARTLAAADFPLRIDVEEPQAVGVDRLANALAVNRLRDQRHPAIVIDLGSAITVDAVSREGTFLGGAILPGIAMSAEALHRFTDLLPLVPMAELADLPEPVGRSTTAAMRSGVYWGAVGAMRELVARQGFVLGDPQLFLTGGAAPAVAELVRDSQNQPARFVPHLTLGGIVLAAAV